MKKSFYSSLRTISAALLCALLPNTASSTPIRIATYNIQRGEGMDGRLNYQRTAKTLAAINPEFVAVQEVDSMTRRTNSTYSLEAIASEMGYNAVYAPTINFDGGKYGIGILSRDKPLRVSQYSLPGCDEARTMVVAEFTDYIFACTHLSLESDERIASIPIINKVASQYKKPFIIAGDWNATPEDPFIKEFSNTFKICNDTTQQSWPADKPTQCLDYIAVYKNPSIKNADGEPATVLDTHVIDNSIASDHRPVFADLDIPIVHPLGRYTELTDSKPHDTDAAWAKLKSDTNTSWASIDTRYRRNDIPSIKTQGTWSGKAWRGERVNAQALLWTNKELTNVEVTATELRSGKNIIPASAVRTNFVRYVMTDELNKDGGGCGYRNPAGFDSSVVADVLDITKSLPIARGTTQPIWMNIWVPRDAKPGTYSGQIMIKGKDMNTQTLQVRLQVLNHTLPEPQKWSMNLDLWQNPYSVARYYDVPLWSKEHFDAMRPIMKMLADAGQYAITTSIMHKPWNGQTEDHYDSMVTRIKHLDGSWSYDYAVFDKYVDFMMNDVGINRLISCYTMIPWDLSFDYYDEATNRVQFIKAKPGDEAYTEYWGNFLKDFSRHLREKGWFDKTCIAMDERPMDAMQAAIKVIKDADPEFKISLAGVYHEEIERDLYYYCLAYGYEFPKDVMRRRRAEGKISTYYTCCTEGFPNTFTFSAPAEATWMALHAVGGDYDGYLRWSYNSWTRDPLRDSRFRTWAAGDCYCIYPGPRSSIRFERLIEGLQDTEKIIQLRREYKRNGQKAKLERMNRLIEQFTPEKTPASKAAKAAEMVRELEKLLNE